MMQDDRIVVTCNTGMMSPKVALALFLAGKLRLTLYDGGFEELTKTVDKKLLVVPKTAESMATEDQVVPPSETDADEESFVNETTSDKNTTAEDQ